MAVAETSPSTLYQNLHLSVLRDFEEKCFIFSFFCNGSKWNLHDNILTIRTCFLSSCTVHTITGKDMFHVPQMLQCPEVSVTLENNMTASSSIATVRSTFWDIF